MQEKTNIFVISGLGADFSVLQRLEFPPELNVVFLDWLMPEKKESFSHYVHRMAERVDDSQPFYLLGYSFGGLVVQEISRIKPAQKTIILGSIRSGKEKSSLLRAGEMTRLFRYVPAGLLDPNLKVMKYALHYLFGATSSNVLNYFTVRDNRYLKWSLNQIAHWRAEPLEGVIQILGDKDHIFPIKNSQPDYVISGGTHLFPVTKSREVSSIIKEVLNLKD
ncbi:alpha/beta hydrolase family protein [Chryseobacterium sp. A301]